MLNLEFFFCYKIESFVSETLLMYERYIMVYVWCIFKFTHTGSK